VVSCNANGENVVVPFVYEVTNATAVEPLVDGVVSPPAASIDGENATLAFKYVCPGPHTLTISAVGKDKRTATASVSFDEKNRAVSSSSSIDVEAG